MEKITKKSKLMITIWIAVLSVFLMLSISGIYAWFVLKATDSTDGMLEGKFTIGGIDLVLYQQDSGTKRAVYSYTDNDEKPDGEKSYLTLENSEIISGQANDLILIMKNEDQGTNSLYVKFKITFYYKIFSASQNKIVYNEITDATVAVPTNISKSADGYYHYVNNNSEDERLQKDAEVTLMTGFTLNYEDIENVNANSLYIEVEIIGYDQ